MEYITSNKGGRKLAFEYNIYIKQKILSNGTVWGDVMGGFSPGGFCPRGDFVLGGILSRGILSGGFCPGVFVRGDFVLEPFNKFLYIFRKSHQIWLNYLSPSLSYGQKTSRVVPNTPPGRIGLNLLTDKRIEV